MDVQRSLMKSAPQSHALSVLRRSGFSKKSNHRLASGMIGETRLVVYESLENPVQAGTCLSRMGAAVNNGWRNG
jgi:hypothetical protein